MTWALIDSSWLAYRALYGLGDLRGGDTDAPTGVLYGFFEQLRTVCRDPHIRSNQAAIFFDSRKSYRALAYPAYKQKRKQERTPDELALLQVVYGQMRLLRTEILPAIGFPVYRQTGLESDDLIARVAADLTYEGRGRKMAVMVTADGDLYQCISESVHWYDPGRGRYLDPTEFFNEKMGLKPEQWAEVKALAGCPSDNVKGIPGVGEKTATVHVLGMLPVQPKRLAAINSSEGKDILQRNLKLVRLPHARTRPLTLTPARYDAEAFFAVCRQYGMRSYLSGPKHLDWQDFFAGDMRPKQTRRIRRRGSHG